MLRAYIDAEAGKEKCLKISAKAKLSKSNLYLICFILLSIMGVFEFALSSQFIFKMKTLFSTGCIR